MCWSGSDGSEARPALVKPVPAAKPNQPPRDPPSSFSSFDRPKITGPGIGVDYDYILGGPEVINEMKRPTHLSNGASNFRPHGGTSKPLGGINSRPHLDYIDGPNIISEMQRPNQDYIDGFNVINEMKRPNLDYIDGPNVINEMKRPNTDHIDGPNVINEMKWPNSDYIDGPEVIDEMKRPNNDYIDGPNVINEMQNPNLDYIDGPEVIAEMQRPTGKPSYKPTYRPDFGFPSPGSVATPPPQPQQTTTPKYKPTFQPGLLATFKPTGPFQVS